MRSFFTAIAALFILGSLSFANANTSISVFPKNNMRIPVGSRIASTTMDEKKFNAIIDLVLQYYAPIVQAKGGVLTPERDWTNPEVNAYADRQGSTWIVHMYGGLARHALVTDDGFAFVMCHELGHHLGGAPTYPADWAADEGQADYWSGSKCMKRIFETADNMGIISHMTVDPLVKDGCETAYGNASEQALCIRIGMAGKSLADTLASLSGGSTQFSTPDTSVVAQTNDNHPEAQCRLDTYFQAALCTKSFNEETSATDPTVGVCTKAGGYKVGFRPLCWYKPGPNE